MAEPFTLAKLREAIAKMESIPPAPFFGRSKMFPSDKAYTFNMGGRDYVVAGDGFWEQLAVKVELDTLGPVDPSKVGLPPLWGITIEDLDHPGHRETLKKIALRIMSSPGRSPGQ